jgi:hypothetical protein
MDCHRAQRDADRGAKRLGPECILWEKRKFLIHHAGGRLNNFNYMTILPNKNII